MYGCAYEIHELNNVSFGLWFGGVLVLRCVYVRVCCLMRSRGLSIGWCVNERTESMNC